MIFNLPKTTIKDKNVPKNAFHSYCNTKQKRLFSDVVKKIIWLNNLSFATTNLKGKQIDEIQIFEISLKQKEKIEELLIIIEKAIPYHIIFIVKYNEEVMLYTSKKHDNIKKKHHAVVDWVFKSDWFNAEDNKYKINLKVSIDEVYQNFCLQFSNDSKNKNLKELIAKEKELKKLNYNIAKLESKIKSSKQFNRTLELNIELNNLKNLRAEIDL